MTKIILFSLLLAVILLVGCANYARREKDITFMPRCDDEGNLYAAKEREAGG